MSPLLIPEIYALVQLIQVQSNVFATERRTAQSLSGAFHATLVKRTQRYQRRYEKLTKSREREKEREKFDVRSISLKI